MNSKRSQESSSEAITDCWACDVQSPRSRKFCIDCGTSLWVECPRCKEEYGVGEKYCGSCGADLAVILNELKAKGDENLENARRQLEADDFDTAMLSLGQVFRMTHPAMAKHREAAGVLRKQAEDSRRDTSDRAAESLREATTAGMKNEFDKALQCLLDIPPSMRTEAVDDKIIELQAKCREISNLESILKRGYRREQYDGVFANVVRLLRLQPDNIIAVKVGKKTIRWLYKAMKNLRAERKYAEAVRLLEQAPSRFAPDKFTLRLEEVRELATLHDQLKSAHIANQALANAATRLHELEPEVNADKLREKINAKRQEWKRLGDPPWWTPKEPPFLEAATNPFVGISPLKPGPLLATALLKDHPSAFLPVIGVALQGMGEAAVDTHLNPRSAGIMKAFSFIRGKKNDAAIGLDIGDAAVKAVQLKRVDGDILVEKLFHLPFTDKAWGKDDPHARTAELEAALDQFAAEFEVAAKPFCLTMPSHLTLSRFFSLPNMPKKKLGDAVAYEAENQIPFPPDQVFWSHDVLNESAKEEANEDDWRIALLASRNENIEQHLAPINRRKWKVELLQSDAFAVYNFHRFAQSKAEEPLPANQATAWLDIGSGSRLIIAAGEDVIWLRNLPAGGRDMTRELGKELRLTRSQAELMKQKLPATKYLAHAFDALDNSQSVLTAEIRRSLDVFAKDHPKLKIAKLHLIGDAAQTHGLLRRLRSGPKTETLGLGTQR